MKRISDTVSGSDPTELWDNAADPRLVKALEEYMAALESGKRVSRQELLNRNPEIARQLTACLQGLSFVQSAAADMMNPPAATRAQEIDGITVQPLGDFQLVKEIGRGGMGIVYEAIQLSLGRRVAVKVLPLAAALDSRQLQRFRNEAQAAAQLHHTNIVPIFAVGCERSVHFYAMQLIDGRSLSEVIAELSQAAAEGRGPLASVDSLSTLHSTRRQEYFRLVARLGLQAAEALDYAHRMGVVHRDIKPANLLLDTTGTLWITDFGLAQFYTDSKLTFTGDVVGTFRYMSPEQASGRSVADQRTDIYSLGMTLYELLTLHRALKGETRQELLMQIDSVEPQAPRSIDKTIPAELQTIIVKAIAKDPSERYRTAGALAEDFRRFLEDKPILARPPSVLDKTIKWTRRHRAAALAALAMLVFLTVGLFISTLLIAREQARTSAAYGEAQNNFQQAYNEVDFFTQFATEELPNDPQLQRYLLEASLAYYQSFLNQQKGNPSIEQQVEAAQDGVSRILKELTANDEAMRLYSAMGLLVSQQSVQQELQLSPEQISAVQDLASSNFGNVWEMRRDARGTGMDRAPQGLSSKAPGVEAQLARILTPAQIGRLWQINRQVRGPAAFTDTDVVAALGLTAAQQEFVQKLRAQAFGALGPGRFNRDDGAQVSQILAQLTPRQKVIWQSLVGSPFNMASLYYPRDRFGFGGPPGGWGRPPP
ncbi:MAG TPA: serine/threonine-protein kinase [Tepidisphaeraceae bacterium]|nr:serine/threonine-protein kinase [Tepidisphaeraceae bacterium]